MNPQPHWKKITIDQKVTIPTADGTGVAQTLTVPVEAWQDPDDGEIYLDATAVKKLDDVRARHMGLMLPEDILELRRYLGLTQSQISRLLQIGEKTWTRWETGRSRPTHGYNLILNALADGRIDQNYLESLARPHRLHRVFGLRSARTEPYRYEFTEAASCTLPQAAAA